MTVATKQNLESIVGAPRPAKILSVDRNTDDVWTLHLEGQGTFGPGQFNMLYVLGVGEVPISISGSPGKTDELLHSVRGVGGVTNAITSLKAGQSVGVRGPFGTSWPMSAAKGRDVVIVTGGIGLAPLRPAIYHIMENRADYGKVSLLYGARTPEEMLYSDEFDNWRASGDIEVLSTVDVALGSWDGDIGVVTTLIPKASADIGNSVAMICGPEVMTRFTIAGLAERGQVKNDIYVSLERNMECGTAHCGHCQLGPKFVCKDGPVFKFTDVAHWFEKREV